MLALFQAADPATPDREQDILVNDRNVVTVEALFKVVKAGGESFPMPDGAVITLADKRRLKVKQTPREVVAVFRSQGGR